MDSLAAPSLRPIGQSYLVSFGGVLSCNIWGPPVDNDRRGDAHSRRQNENQCERTFIRSGDNKAGDDSECGDGEPNREQPDPTRSRIPLPQRATQLAAAQEADERSAHHDGRNPVRGFLDVEIMQCQEQSDTDEHSDGELNQLCLGLGLEAK
jgi:hypothetical protein